MQKIELNQAANAKTTQAIAKMIAAISDLKRLCLIASTKYIIAVTIPVTPNSKQIKCQLFRAAQSLPIKSEACAADAIAASSNVSAPTINGNSTFKTFGLIFI